MGGTEGCTVNRRKSIGTFQKRNPMMKTQMHGNYHEPDQSILLFLIGLKLFWFYWEMHKIIDTLKLSENVAKRRALVLFPTTSTFRLFFTSTIKFTFHKNKKVAYPRLFELWGRARRPSASGFSVLPFRFFVLSNYLDFYILSNRDFLFFFIFFV